MSDVPIPAPRSTNRARRRAVVGLLALSFVPPAARLTYLVAANVSHLRASLLGALLVANALVWFLPAVIALGRSSEAARGVAVVTTIATLCVNVLVLLAGLAIEGPVRLPVGSC